jgi:hypothetical protein
MNIPDEAVEAAAREVYHTSGRYRVMPYSQAKSECVEEATRILAAAAPFIASQAWEEGWAHYRMHFSPNDPEYGSNPYRSGT